MRIGPGTPCRDCGDEYGQHSKDCSVRIAQEKKQKEFEEIEANCRYIAGSCPSAVGDLAKALLVIIEKIKVLERRRFD